MDPTLERRETPPRTPAEWERIKTLFVELRAAPFDERERRLRDLAAASVELHAETIELLKRDAGQAPFDGDPAAAIGLVEPTQFSEVPGFKIPGVRVAHRIGHGAFAIVYEAKQTSPPRAVALKVLTGLQSNERARAIFERETEALAKLQHPGIAQLFASGVLATGSPYLLMELVQGESLTTYVQRKALSIADRLALIRSTCAAIEHAHQRGVIHRDLKPENILITETGQPKVLDFGIAKLQDSSAEVATVRLTRDHVMGTLAYMSPEQAAPDATAADTRSDVFSLGVLLFETVTGRLPLSTHRMLLPTALAKVRESERPRARSVDTSVPRDLDIILAKALTLDPERRYQSAAQLSEDLRRFLATEPILARPPSAGYMLSRFTKRRKGAVALVGTGFVIIIGLILALAVALARARQDYATARDTVGTIVTGLADRLGPQIGTAAARREMLESVLVRAQAFQRSHPDDSVASASYYRLLDAISDIRFETDELDEALSLRRQVLAWREAEVNREPTPARRSAVSIAMVRVGDIDVRRADFAGAQEWYERARDIDAQLASQKPGAREWVDNLTWSFERLADLQRRRGRFGEAVQLTDERLRTAEGLRHEYPGDQSDYAMAVAHLYRIYLAFDCNDNTAVDAHIAAAHPLLEGLLERNPLNRGYRYGRFSLLGFEARRAEGLHAFTDQEALLRRLVREASTLHSADPADPQTAVMSVNANNQLMRCLLDRGETDEVMSMLGSLRSLASSLTTGPEPRVDAFIAEAWFHETTARCQTARGNAQAAEDAANKAQTVWETARRRYPTHAELLCVIAPWWTQRYPEHRRDCALATEMTAQCLDSTAWVDPVLLLTMGEIMVNCRSQTGAIRILERLNSGLKSDPLVPPEITDRFNKLRARVDELVGD